MKNQKLFDKTVGILVKAYLNDTLDYFNCRACAVGNIVAHNMGITLVKKDKLIIPSDENYIGDWADAVKLGDGEVDSRYLNAPNTKKEVLASEYTALQLAKIEKAFHDGVGKDGLDNYNGLMLVVDYLAYIHGIDLPDANTAKSLFTKELAV